MAELLGAAGRGPLTQDEAPKLAVVLGAARSGTTLMRSLLDAHPEIGCPAEAGVPGLINHMRRVWATVCSSDGSSMSGDPLQADAPDPGSLPSVLPLPPYAESAIKRSVDDVMRYYCRRNGERIYCDKSLDNVQHLPAVYHSYPEVKCIVLVRHVMDTIASGLEASPWGFNAFGYAPFVQATPDNTVAALARYWEMQVSHALMWHSEHPEISCLIRYEDLVADAEATLARLFGFLDVDPSVKVMQNSFGRFTVMSGPGDYKLAYTHDINTDSVGRGKRIPIKMIPPPLLERLNALLVELAYPPMTEQWNVEPRPVSTASGEASGYLKQLLTSFQGDWSHDIESVAIIADDDCDLRWVVEPRSQLLRRGDGDVDLVVAGAVEDLACMMDGQANIGTLMRGGRIRILPASPSAQRHIDLPRVMTSLVSGLREACIQRR